MHLICHLNSQEYPSEEFVVVTHYPGKIGNHRHFNSEDIMFLNCYVTSCDCMFKGLCEFLGRSSDR